MTTPADARPPDDRLADLLAAYDAALAAGLPPPPGWAELDSATRTRLESDRAVLDGLERLWPRSRPPAPVPVGPSAASFPFDFGRFRVRRQLGAGGCGVVYLADDPVLGRPVALKVPRPAVLIEPDLRRRFLREAQAAAVLSHPNIVPVYEAGAVGGTCYIAAEFCPGPTLAGWLLDRAGPPPPRDAAALLAQLAAAIGYAHRRGIVHRDLKPSNVLMAGDRRQGAGDREDRATGSSRVPVSCPLSPKVTDFGFAKLLERDDDATRTGVVMGTPQYMAPEQAEGRLAAVGPATDVYALGAVLYELLTGRPPIRGASQPDTLRQVVAVQPARPRALRPDVPKDLEAVCLKCLEKSPARRYPDGDALAADLGRFLAGQPTLARPVRWPERVGKWCRRNPVVASLAGVLAAAAVALVGLAGAYQRHLADQNGELAAALGREREQADEADRQRRRADDRARAARRQAYLTQMRYAGGLARAGRLTDRAVGDWGPADGEDLRGFEWHYLARLGRASRAWAGHTAPVAAVRVSADGRTVASVAGRELRLWDADTGGLLAAWGHAADLGDDPALSADGRAVAVGLGGPHSDLLPVLLFTRGEPAPRVVVPGGAELSRLRFVGGDRLLVVGTAAGFGVFDAATGAAVRSITRPGATPWMVVPDPAGPRVALGFAAGRPHPGRTEVAVYDLGAGRPLAEWTAPRSYTEGAYSADGRHLAVGDPTDAEMQIWDRSGTRLRAAVRLDGGVKPDVIDALPDGRLAVVGWGRGDSATEVRVGIWDPTDGSWRVARLNLGCVVRSAALRPDGRVLVVGGADHAVRLIDLDPPAPQVAWPAHGRAEAWAVAVSPDSRTVVTGGDDHIVRVWDVRTSSCRAAAADHRSLVTSAAYAPDGAWFATGSFDGTVRLRDPATGAARRVLELGGRVRAVAASPDGRHVAATGNGGRLGVWEAATGRPVLAVAEGVPFGAPAAVFTADGRFVIAPADGGVLAWWDVAAGRRGRVVTAVPRIGGLALTPDGRTLVVAAETGELAFRDAATGELLRRGFGPPRRLTGAAVAPDGKTVATAGHDGAVRLWHAATATELFPLVESGPQVNEVAFAPDGSFLAAVRHDGQLLLWPTRDP